MPVPYDQHFGYTDIQISSYINYLGQDRQLPDLNKSQTNNLEDFLETIPKITLKVNKKDKITLSGLACQA